jgi:hypothetical protein
VQCNEIDRKAVAPHSRAASGDYNLAIDGSQTPIVERARGVGFSGSSESAAPNSAACGHERTSCQHYRRGKECAFGDCQQYQSAVDE